jgi:hypothetical protein
VEGENVVEQDGVPSAEQVMKRGGITRAAVAVVVGAVMAVLVGLRVVNDPREHAQEDKPVACDAPRPTDPPCRRRGADPARRDAAADTPQLGRLALLVAQALLLAAYLGVALPLADQPLRRVGGEFVDLRGGQRLGDPGPGQPAVGHA